MIKVKSHYKEIVGMFQQLTGSKSMWQVFQDVIEVIALAIQNSCEVFPDRMENNEKKYLNTIKKYSDDEIKLIVEIYCQIVDMLEENPYQDLLGDLYMQLDMGSSALGQFFTPYNISEAMAKMSLEKNIVLDCIEKNRYVKINEPCIGGGANIIGSLSALHDLGVNWQEKCIIVGQDLSYVTATMAYVVLSLLGCQAVIKVADTLTRPYTSFWDEIKNKSLVWYTPMFVLYGADRRV